MSNIIVLHDGTLLTEYLICNDRRIIIHHKRKDEWECHRLLTNGSTEFCKAFRYGKECFHVRKVREYRELLTSSKGTMRDEEQGG